MSQFAEKSILAKLLATENIHVEHQKTSTAYFNLETRTVVLPIFKETSADLYDLLIGHEVGHALETPADGWHSSISEKGVGFKSFLNIIEDARIERKMKNRYPGLRRSFYNGYQELFEKNFFGVEGMDVNKLKFIDRINLHAKVGSFLNVKFSEEEQAIVNRLDDLNTWEDVVALASELYERAENSTEELDFEQFMNALGDIMEDGDGEFDPSADYVEVPNSDNSDDKEKPQTPSSTGQKSEENTEEDSKSSSSDDTEEKSEEKSEEKEDGSSEGSESDDTEESPAPTSFTDENFRRNEDSLLDANARETFYAKLPILNPADFIVGINTVEKMLKFSVGGAAYRAGKTAEQVKMELYKEFLAKNSKYLSSMAQDFERKKKAKSLMRAQTSKTGRINMDKVWAYKITEDLFLQNTVVPNGQNHGMLLYLDMSGSMSSNMSGTMEQLVLLASFCQKVRIPFEVYGFITNSSAPQTYFDTVRSRNNLSDPNNLMISDPSFRMLQLVATGVSGGKFKTQMANILALGQSYNRSYHDLYLDGTAANSFGLGSTPLEEAILLGRYIAEDFKNRNRVEVLSSVFLTDGEGDCNFETVGHNHNDYHRKNLAIVDSKTRRTFSQQYDGVSYRSRSYCKALLELYRETTGSRMINFYLMGSYDLKYFLARSLVPGTVSDATRKAFKKEGAALLKNINGFDDQFLIKAGSSLQITEDTLTVDSNDKKELTKAFKAFQDKKSIGRVILTKMVEAVA
jgi:hypothetical protein